MSYEIIENVELPSIVKAARTGEFTSVIQSMAAKKLANPSAPVSIRISKADENWVLDDNGKRTGHKLYSAAIAWGRDKGIKFKLRTNVEALGGDGGIWVSDKSPALTKVAATE